MSALLDEDVLTSLLQEAGESYPVPDAELPVPEEPRPWHRSRWVRGTAVAAALVAGAVVVSSVTGGGGGPSTRQTAAASKAAAGSDLSAAGVTGELAPAPLPEAAGGGAAVGGTTGGGTTGGSVTGLSSGRVQLGTASPAGEDARVVKTGEMSLQVADGKVGATVRQVQALVAGLRGWVASSQSEEAADHPSATVTLRVPVTAFASLTDQLRGLPVKVVSSSESGKDITATYADTTAQLASLKAARSRFLAILAQARTINETLAVQQRVDDVQQQVDQLEGQRRVLADTSDYGTVTVSVAEKGAALQVRSTGAWSRAWHEATHGFSSGLQSLVAGSGRFLLVLLVGAVLLGLGRLGWRRARRRLV